MKVLLVDDEPDIRKIAKLSLEAVGKHLALIAADAAEAIALAAVELPDLIILDVMMPGTDGPSTLVELRKNPALAATPVIFMTAKAQRAETDRYIAMGAKGVIGKPFDPMTLPDQIKALLS